MRSLAGSRRIVAANMAWSAQSRRGLGLVQRVEQEVHRRVRGVVGELRAVGDRHPLPDSAGRGQLRAGLAGPLRDQCEHHPLDLLAVEAAPGGVPAQRRPDPEPLPDSIQGPHRVQSARVQLLHLAPELGGTGGGDRLLRGGEPGDEATSRAGLARSSWSAHPKLWITFATGFPLTGCRARLDTVDRARVCL